MLYTIQQPELFKKKSKKLLYAVQQLAFLFPKNREPKIKETMDVSTISLSLAKNHGLPVSPSIRGFVLDIFNERDFGSPVCIHDNLIHQRLHEINTKASRL